MISERPQSDDKDKTLAYDSESFFHHSRQNSAERIFHLFKTAAGKRLQFDIGVICHRFQPCQT